MRLPYLNNSKNEIVTYSLKKACKIGNRLHDFGKSVCNYRKTLSQKAGAIDNFLSLLQIKYIKIK